MNVGLQIRRLQVRVLPGALSKILATSHNFGTTPRLLMPALILTCRKFVNGYSRVGFAGAKDYGRKIRFVG